MSDKEELKFTDWFFTRPKTSGFLAFFILIVLGAFLLMQRYFVLEKEEHLEMTNILSPVRQNIEQSLRNCYPTALSLALTINDKGVPENFDAIGAALLKSNSAISMVQLIPKGVIKYIYPLKGNEPALNLNVFKMRNHRIPALIAVKTKKMGFNGPFELKQGGKAIVGEFPIFKNNKFWGFSAVVIKMDTFLKIAGFNSIDTNRYSIQFSWKNPLTQKEEFFLPQHKVNFSKDYYISTNIPDGGWKVYLIANNSYGLYYQLLFPGVLFFVVAVLFGFLVHIILKRRMELQRLVYSKTRALLKSEMKFKSTFDQAAIGIGYIDSATGTYLEINKHYCDFFGYTVKEMEGKKYQDVTYPDDLEIGLADFEKLQKGLINEFTVEKRYVTKKGAVVWGNLTVSILYDGKRKSGINIAILEDITSKKESEEQISKSAAQFKSLFNDSPIPLWEEDFSEVKSYLLQLGLVNENPDKVISYFDNHPEVVHTCISLVKIINVNDECLQLYSVDSKKALKKSLSSIIDEDAMDAFTKELVAITQGKKKLSLDAKIKNSKGETRDINLRWNVVRGFEDSLSRVIVSTEDVTMQKDHEKAMQEAQHKFEDLVNSIDGIVWECTYEDHKLTFISEKTKEFTGYTPEEWMDDADFWDNHVHNDDNAAYAMAFRNITSGDNINFEYRLITKRGDVLWIKELVTVVFESGKPVRLRGIMIDVTKAKEAEKDLQSSFTLVAEQNKRLLNFSYIVSHNLRSHTSNIQSISNLIDESESEEERLELVQYLKTVSQNLDETISNLNEMVNIKSNIGILIEPLNLLDYVHKTIDVLSESIAVYDATIDIEVDDRIMVDYNSAYLESILLNITSNALKYRHAQRSPIIRISSFTEGNKTVLQISDNGIGIDLKRHGDKLFGMYKTFNNNPDAKGIGLFITKNQIDAMGGSVVVESEPDLGTTFRIYFR